MMIEDKLKARNGFSDVEKIVADYILDKREAIREESARHIAAQTYTSAASVTRLCQRLGYEGYHDFREAYLNELAYLSSHFQNLDPNYPFEEKDSPMRVAGKIGTLYKETIDDALSLITAEQLHDVCGVISRSRVIHVFSAGSHVHLAQPFKEKMLKLGKQVDIIRQHDLAYFQMDCAGKDECFLFISYSGEIENLIRIAAKGRQRGIPMICFTSYGNNRLSKLCSYSLYVSTREKLITNLGNYGVHLSVLYLFDVLYSVYFNQNYQKNLEQKVRVAGDFEKIRDSDNPILKENPK